MSAEIVNLDFYKIERFISRPIARPGYVKVPAPFGGYAWFPRSDFSAKELADIDFINEEIGE